MLGRAHQAGIGGVDIHHRVVPDIPRHDRAAEMVDILHPVHDPRRVIEILQGRVAVLPGVDIEHPRRGTAGRHVHPRARR